MTTYYLVLQLLSFLKRVFPVQWIDIRRDIPRVDGAYVRVRLYNRFLGERNIEAEKILSTYAAKFGIETVHPAWFGTVSSASSEQSSKESCAPLLLKGSFNPRVDAKARRLLDAGLSIRLCANYSSPPEIGLALLRRADFRQARLDAWNIEVGAYLKNEQRISGNFSGARPLDALVRLLPAIDVVSSRFDRQQIATIIDVLGKSKDGALYAYGFVRNPYCFWEWVTALETYAMAGNEVSRVLCQATTIDSSAYERFACRIIDSDVDELLESDTLHPGIRPLLLARQNPG